MSAKIESLEKSVAKLTIEVASDAFEAAVQKVYLKQRSKIQLPGFRKGKAPRMMIEKIYGEGIFYEDAVNEVLPQAYAEAIEETGIEPTSRPEIDILQVGKGKDLIISAVVAVKPVVTLGQYKDLEYTQEPLEVTEEEVEEELKRIQEQNARMVTVEDRPVQDGDTVVIDFEGFQDGVAFEGGKGENYELVIGSHSFIDTFEEQLIGKTTGEETEVNVTFPEEYQAEELAGKPALFKVKINTIKYKELPELDDDFAGDVSDYDTFAEYRESVKAGLLEKKETAAAEEKKNALVEAAVANATMDVADAMVADEAERMVDNFAQRIAQQGISFEQYLEYTGSKKEDMIEQAKPEALKNIRTSAVLEAVAAAEALEATEEELENEFTQMAAMYQMPVEDIKKYLGSQSEAIKSDIVIRKAADLIADSAK
ncbi:MAG: trigger factor [Lachnospiraceae bacterium]|nr:trigger factor [Lachnospiraceae bacterium]